MSTSNGILKHHIERLPAITEAVLQRGRRRAAETAVSMSQKGAMKAAADRCNAAINRLIELVFEEDEIGRCNIDADGLFNQRIASPWSTRNYGRYALMRTEADVLRLHVDRLQDVSVAPLFIYYGDLKRWGVNVEDYSDMGAAVAYWRKAKLGARDYQSLLHMVRNQRAKP